MSQSILVRNPYKSQVGNKAEDIHRMHSPLCPLCPLTLVWNAVLRSKGAHTRIKIPAHTAVTSTLRRLCARRRYVHHPASFLYTPPSRPPSGVIPAQAGILTRVVLYEGLTVVDNYAEIPSRHISYGKCGELCVLQSLVWIRAIYNSWRPCPG